MKARLPQGYGGGPGNMQSMLKQAQKMQEDMQTAQAELAKVKAAPVAENDLAAELEALRAKCATLEEELTQCKSSASAETAELEAYRRAERMERMARERAEQVYSLTNGILADASAQVDGVADQIGNLADTVMLQLEQLKGVVGSSKEALKSASESLYSLRPEEN